MEAPLLISKADFAGRIDLSSNLLDKRLAEHIRHAEEFDLCGLMGDKFYYYFMSFFNAQGVIDPSAPPAVVNMLNGGSYSLEPNAPINGNVLEDPNAFEFTPANAERTYPGIKPVLVYFAGARLTRNGDFFHTPTGLMQKNNDYSDHVSTSARNLVATQHNNQAIAYWQKNLDYIRYDVDLYGDFFKGVCGCETPRNGRRPRIISI